MKLHLLLAFLILLSGCTSPSVLAEAEQIQVVPLAQGEQQARGAAAEWLSLLDRDQFQQAWDAGSPRLRQQVPTPAAVARLQSARQRLGACAKRSTAHARKDGPYWLLEYTSEYRQAGKFQERVVLQEEQGTWRVTGYFLHEP